MKVKLKNLGCQSQPPHACQVPGPRARGHPNSRPDSLARDKLGDYFWSTPPYQRQRPGRPGRNPLSSALSVPPGIYFANVPQQLSCGDSACWLELSTPHLTKLNFGLTLQIPGIRTWHLL